MIKNKHILTNWQLPGRWPTITSIDLHTEGEPLRVIVEGLPSIPGKTILEKRKYFNDHYDHYRTGIMLEPRGHSDMYGAILTEPVEPGSDLGVFFLHNEGYSTMCGHAIIALTKLVLEVGLVQPSDNDANVIFDAPPGKISARASRTSGTVNRVFFRNVPSFVLLEDQQVKVSKLGVIPFSIAYGGAFYALVEASVLGIPLLPRNVNFLKNAGKQIKEAIVQKFPVTHPMEEELGFLYGVIFTGPPQEESHHSRNICIFADGEVDRSPTGSGISARAAYHHRKGELKTGEKITVESIIGTTMDVEVVGTASMGADPAVIPEVSGTAHFTGMHKFTFDPDDPLKNGFLVR